MIKKTLLTGDSDNDYQPMRFLRILKYYININNLIDISQKHCIYLYSDNFNTIKYFNV